MIFQLFLPLSAFSADAACQLNVLRHDRDTLCVNGTKVRVLKESHQVRLGRLLQRQDGIGLEAEIGLEILGHFADETLKGGFADQEIRGLLVLANLSERHGSGTVPVGLLDTPSGGRGFAGGLGGKLLAGSLSSGGLAGGLTRDEQRSYSTCIVEMIP